MVGLFRMIFIFVVVYFGVKLLGRLLAPRKPGAHGNFGYRNREDRDRRKEGEVRIEYTHKNKKQKRREDIVEGGEYVDYEELD